MSSTTGGETRKVSVSQMRFTDAFHSNQQPSGWLFEGALASGRTAVSGAVQVNNVADVVNHLTVVTRWWRVRERTLQEASGSERSSLATVIPRFCSSPKANRPELVCLGVRSTQGSHRERGTFVHRLHSYSGIEHLREPKPARRIRHSLEWLHFFERGKAIFWRGVEN